MTTLISIGLIVAGVALAIVGYLRARGPWARYQTLKAQDENIARYESWRGGLRDAGPTGASIAMAVLRRQARDGAIVAGVGVVLAIAGLIVR
ncbi:MAG TPA: hypothetical protein VE011_12470 [Candidatus Dormibacteraeota bacterium]|nr:hypothetical protein [Candidatus Dormibacteraeota bacterium]